MPIFEYRCSGCRDQFESLVLNSSPAPECPSCGSRDRRDAAEFLKLAGEIPIETRITTYDLEDANRALRDLADGRLNGAAVLRIGA